MPAMDNIGQFLKKGTSMGNVTEPPRIHREERSKHSPNIFSELLCFLCRIEKSGRPNRTMSAPLSPMGARRLHHGNRRGTFFHGITQKRSVNSPLFCRLVVLHLFPLVLPRSKGQVEVSMTAGLNYRE